MKHAHCIVIAYYVVKPHAAKLAALPVCSIFGYDGHAAEEILYVNWLNMVRAGLMGLEYFTPENRKWRQVGLQQ